MTKGVRLQAEVFEPGELLTAFSAGRTDIGGIVTFCGLARADQGDETVLELVAYPGFTEKAIAKVMDEAQVRFSLLDAQVVHRVGFIRPGETIVFVAAAAAHRREAFQAADFLMDYLKSRAPFWKKEHGPAGGKWIEPTDRDRADAERWD